MKTLKAIQYTERCIAVIGDTKPLKDQLKQAGGKFNPYLKVNGSTVAGWVFSVNRKDQIAGIIEGVTIEAQPIDVKPEPKPIEPMVNPIEPMKAKKPTREKQPEFKMLVKFSGFCELEKVFTSEKEMVKFCENQRKIREQAVNDICGKPCYDNGKRRFSTRDNEKEIEDFNAELAKFDIKQLKVQFINLL